MTGFIKHDEPVLIWTGRAMLDGVMTVPRTAEGLVVIVGLGGTFHHQPIRAIASEFHDERFATLIADVLTGDEQQFDSRTGHFRLDTALLTSRIRDIVEWAQSEETTRALPVALFAGAATAAACISASEQVTLFAMTLNAPRFDAVRDWLPALAVPTLFLFDHRPTFENMCELTQNQCVTSVVTVPGASSLIDNDLAAAMAARESVSWFSENVPAPAMA
ncbi:MAG TPA: hypothetical protein VF980_00655 [Thermoanaerobaculia bacterium]